jgi:hypothetical protein
MANPAAKMICSICGVQMNHHCDKLVHRTGLQETVPEHSSQTESLFDGLVYEFHSCPNCGCVASRAV